jgi:hypothetical protein
MKNKLGALGLTMQNIIPATTRKDEAPPSMDVTELDNVL